MARQKASDRIADLQRGIADLTKDLALWQQALWHSRTMDPDACVELPEADARGDVIKGGGWYRYTLYNLEGSAGGVLLITFVVEGQRDSIQPRYFEEWRARVARGDGVFTERRALEMLNAKLAERLRRALQPLRDLAALSGGDDRYRVESKGMKRGYYRIVDDVHGTVVRSGFTSKAAAQQIADGMNGWRAAARVGE